MVYLRMMPLGLAGGSQETTTLLAEDGTALMPAGGPGTEGAKLGPQEGPGAPCNPPACRTMQPVLGQGHLSTGGSGPLPT